MPIYSVIWLIVSAKNLKIRAKLIAKQTQKTPSLHWIGAFIFWRINYISVAKMRGMIYAWKNLKFI